MREGDLAWVFPFFAELCVLCVACYLLHHLGFVLSSAADFQLRLSAALDFSAYPGILFSLSAEPPGHMFKGFQNVLHTVPFGTK